RSGAHELDVLGQQHRQLIFRDRYRTAGAAVDHRDRATPVALATDAPVAQAVVDAPLALPALAELRDQMLEGVAVILAVQFAGMDDSEALGILVRVPVLPLGGVV